MKQNIFIECPFCNSKSISTGFERRGEDENSIGGIAVTCNKCGASVFKKTYGEALSTWNTRPKINR